MEFSKRRAIVLFSGGQDSTTCLAWALNRFDYVETIGFYYGQRHDVELDCRNVVLSKIRNTFPLWNTRLGPDQVVDISVLSDLTNSALTSNNLIEDGDNGLPNTFVPGRNLLFLTLSASLAYQRKIQNIVTGVCETDYSGYPDCRDDTIKALQVALNLGMESKFRLHTPLMSLDKSSTWELAHQLGGEDLVKLIIDETHTCYIGERSKLWDWGAGCAECPACKIRSSGWYEYCNKL